MNPETTIYRTALKVTSLAMLGLVVLGLVIGWWMAGAIGATAALIGVAIAALTGLSTQGAMWWGHRKEVTSMAAIVLGTWLLKMVVIVIALVILRGYEDFHRGLFFAFVCVGVFATLAIDVWVLHKGRLPYVNPGSNV